MDPRQRLAGCARVRETALRIQTFVLNLQTRRTHRQLYPINRRSCRLQRLQAQREHTAHSRLSPLMTCRGAATSEPPLVQTATQFWGEGGDADLPAVGRISASRAGGQKPWFLPIFPASGNQSRGSLLWSNATGR